MDRTAIKNLHGSSTLLEFLYVHETNPINYIFRVINTIRAMSKTEGKNELIIHNHTLQRNSFLLLHILGLGGVISTLHYDPPLYRSFKLLPTLKFKGKSIAISKNQYQRLKRFLGSFLFAYVHNGIPVDEFPFCKEKDEYFISINAITPSKGVHEAVKFSKRIKARLFLIGPIQDHEYFKTLAKYFGKDVVYLGEVDENTKRSLLCKAKALVFPVLREEYFGLNMVEAMACGTPVLAFNRGAVPEIVQHGETGFLGSSIEELIKYVPALDTLNPAIIREHAKKFSSRNMALKYARIYKMILEEKGKDLQ